MTGAYTARPTRRRQVDRQYLTFRHWSGVTPYTSSYEFAGSCVFGKQSPGSLSLRPTFGLPQKRGGHIPKLRPLVCRVPWGAITCWPRSSRPSHLCRFAVRAECGYAERFFLEGSSPSSTPQRGALRACTRVDGTRICLSAHAHTSDANPVRRLGSFPPSPHRTTPRGRNINRLSITSPFRDRLRPA